MGSAAVGVSLYLTPTAFGRLVGFSGDEPYILQLAGAAMTGYAAAILVGRRDAAWRPLRFVLVATYVFAAVAFMAGLVAFASGHTSGFVFLFSLWAVVTAYTIGRVLVARRSPIDGPHDVSRFTVWVVAVATLSALVFGLAPQIARPFAELVGYRGIDEYAYRLAGAATVGYAAMGVGELRSQRWGDIWLANLMGLVFNALACTASAVEIASGRPTLLAIVTGLASGAFTIAFLVIHRRGGR